MSMHNDDSSRLADTENVTSFDRLTTIRTSARARSWAKTAALALATAGVIAGATQVGALGSHGQKPNNVNEGEAIGVRTTPAEDVAEVMEAEARAVVGSDGRGADATFDTLASRPLAQETTIRSDEPYELSLLLDSDADRHWRLYLSNEQPQDDDPVATCASKLETGWYLSCEPTIVDGTRVVVSVAALPRENFAGTDDAPQRGDVRFVRSIFTVEGNGPIAAFHDAVDAPAGSDPRRIFATTVAEAVDLVTDRSLGFLDPAHSS